MSEEYSYDLQKLYLEFLQGDKELFERMQDQLNWLHAAQQNKYKN